jgi:hypothetical protein
VNNGEHQSSAYHQVVLMRAGSGASLSGVDLMRTSSAARLHVKQIRPAATSCYTGATSAMVYDGVTGAELGSSDAQEWAVELAWVDAMCRVTAHLPEPLAGGPSPLIPHR